MAIVRVNMYSTLWGQQLRNVIHLLAPDLTPSVVADIHTKVREKWIGFIALNQSTHITWYRTDVTEVGTGPNAPTSTVTFVQGGSFFSDFKLWGPACFVYQLRTETAGVSGRGRQYLAGFYTSEIESGFWSQQRLIVMNDLANTLKAWWLSPSPQSGFSLIVCSRTDPQGSLKFVTDIVPRPLPGTQVRRNIGRGS